jgi:cell division protease FtsH
MVCEYGMSDLLGPRTFGEPSGHVFLGKDMTRERNYSEETAATIDKEIHRLLSSAYEGAKRILTENKDALDRIAAALLERETLDGEELDKVIAGETLPALYREEGGENLRPPRKPAGEEKNEIAPVLRPHPVQPS